MPSSTATSESVSASDRGLAPSDLDAPGTVFLDASRPDPDGPSSADRCLLFQEPKQILRADVPADVAGVLRNADDALEAGYFVAGALTYEAGLAITGMAAHPVDGPLVWLGVYDGPTEWSSADVARGFASLEESPQVRNARFDVSRNAYRAALERIKSLIREGDVYQINYTGPVRFECDPGDALRLYAQMRRRQPVPYGAWLHLGDRRILCASPELFVRRDGGRLVTRPMKGTIRRGMTLEEDDRLRHRLETDPKSRAENLMIVDLLRNDLSRCCTPGSVRVPSLFSTETYDTLTQMTSTVEGELVPDARLSTILDALFPCGSVTGAPKRRAMQRIYELETGPRGMYCGAIGYAGPDDTACFNVAIRTVTLRDGDPCGSRALSGVMGTGSGVVWDSDPDAEYEECRLKARFLTDPANNEPSTFRLIETMRASDRRIDLWPYHWRRLEKSAAYFGFDVDRARIGAALNAALEETPLTSALVRMTVGRDGDPEVDVRAMPPQPDRWTAAIARELAQPHNPFFYHKTTRRTEYTRALEEANAAGVDEAILVTPEGRVTEGARSNVIAEIDDQWVTPPVEDGLLGGVYRAFLLDTEPRMCEGSLSVDDLRQASRLFCCNAVRGRIPVTLEKDLRASHRH
ncbi:MAG: aminodeoxychorismate synthase component I [Bacteroidetes bacterium]|jgi:para-aminobenzoate synthetase/4-amino-4-deoxychorismate lyase|nr:aminodeoxychorismate synthase component I [Bacteroidota bacterium]